MRKSLKQINLERRRQSFIQRLILIKVEAGSLGLFKTMHSIDEAVKAVGWEIDSIERENNV